MIQYHTLGLNVLADWDPRQEEWQEQNATLLASFEAGFQNLTIANNDPAPKQTLGQSARKVLTPKSIKKACGRSDDPGAWFANKTFVQEGTYIRPQESDTSKRPSILDSSAKKLKQTFSSASCLGKRRSADHDEEQDPPARLVKKACRTSYIKVDELMGDAAHYNFDLNKPAYASRNKPLADAVLTNEQVFGTFAFSSPRTPPDINNHSAFQLSSNPVYDNSVVYPESHGYLDELEALSKSARGVDQAGSSKNDQVKEQEEPSLRELRKMLRQPRRGVRTLPPILEEEGSVDGRRSVDENPKSRPSGVDEAVTDLSRRWL